MPSVESITAALAAVNDPEINRPITELGMVKSVDVAADGAVRVAVYLTVSGCPMRETITERVTTTVSALPGVTSVVVELDVMSDAQRAGRHRSNLLEPLGGVCSRPRQAFGAEDEQADDRHDHDLADPDVEHDGDLAG